MSKTFVCLIAFLHSQHSAMMSCEEDDAAETGISEPGTSKRKKVFTFLVLCLNILVGNLFFSVPVPFLTTEIVKSRNQPPLVGGILSGIFNFLAMIASVVAGPIAARTTVHRMMGYSAISYMLTSLVFLIPVPNNIVFDVIVALSRWV